MRWSMALIIALLGLGCSDSPKEGDKKAPASKAATASKPAPKAAMKSAGSLPIGKLAKDVKEVAGAIKKGGPGLTEAQFEALLLGLSACEVKTNGIDRKCAAYKAYREGRKNRGTLVKDWGGMLSAMGRKHISNESPAVRIQAASLMGSIFGSSKESQAAIVKAAQGEKHPRVLKAMLRSVSSSIKKNDAVRQLMLANANHADEKVRMEVVGALTSSWAKDTEGTLEKAMEIVEKDPAVEVRQYACRRLGERADARALPLLKKLTAQPSESKLYSACVRGVIAMWSAPVPHKAPSKEAYAHTLALFKKTPRSKSHPPWTAISAVEWASKKKFQEAAPWFKQADLNAALIDIVKDRKANWLARTGAVDALKRLGATPAQFEALKKAYSGADGKASTDKHVLDKIEKAMGQAKKKSGLKKGK
jgi:hypothetical protein